MASFFVGCKGPSEQTDAPTTPNITSGTTAQSDKPTSSETRLQTLPTPDDVVAEYSDIIAEIGTVAQSKADVVELSDGRTAQRVAVSGSASAEQITSLKNSAISRADNVLGASFVEVAEKLYYFDYENSVGERMRVIYADCPFGQLTGEVRQTNALSMRSFDARALTADDISALLEEITGGAVEINSDDNVIIIMTSAPVNEGESVKPDPDETADTSAPDGGTSAPQPTETDATLPPDTTTPPTTPQSTEPKVNFDIGEYISNGLDIYYGGAHIQYGLSLYMTIDIDSAVYTSLKMYNYIFYIKDITAGQTSYTPYKGVGYNESIDDLKTMIVEIIPYGVTKEILSLYTYVDSFIRFDDDSKGFDPVKYAYDKGVEDRGAGGQYFFPLNHTYSIYAQAINGNSEVVFEFITIEYRARWYESAQKDIARKNDPAKPVLYENGVTVTGYKLKNLLGISKEFYNSERYPIYNEDAKSLFDFNSRTKMCVWERFEAGDTFTVEFTTNEPIRLHAFSLVTAGDSFAYHERYAEYVTLEGSTDGINYVTLADDCRLREPNANWSETYYKITNPGTYKYYRVTFNNMQSSVLQYAEMWLWTASN